MKIFNHVDAFVIHLRKKRFKRCLDVLHVVASVIQNDINLSSHFLNHLFQKPPVCLGTDADRSAYPIELPAVFVNVDTKNCRLLTKVLPPHVKGSALGHSYLQEAYFLTPPMAKIAIVDRKIVVPFVDCALAALDKYIQQVSVKGVLYRHILSNVPSRICEVLQYSTWASAPP